MDSTKLVTLGLNANRGCSREAWIPSALKSALFVFFLENSTVLIASKGRELVNLSKKSKKENLKVDPISWVDEKEKTCGFADVH